MGLPAPQAQRAVKRGGRRPIGSDSVSAPFPQPWKPTTSALLPASCSFWFPPYFS